LTSHEFIRKLALPFEQGEEIASLIKVMAQLLIQLIARSGAPAEIAC